ncbi:MAG: hypothetical protein ACUVTO_08895 [Candidatus Caldatribacteriaceae bacterium]
MKKYAWLLVIAAFAIAILAIAGCKPAEAPGESPTPTPAPTPTPDTACPKVVSTVVQNLYGATGDNLAQIIITFDENIDLTSYACLSQADSWTIEVERFYREGCESGCPKKVKVTAIEGIGIEDNRIIIKFETDTPLICSEEDAVNFGCYVRGGACEPRCLCITAADLVKWKTGCYIADELGNICCGAEGKACCTSLCPTCPTPAPCPWGSVCQ